MDARDQSAFLTAYCASTRYRASTRYPTSATWDSLFILRADTVVHFHNRVRGIVLGPVPSESDLLQVFGDNNCTLNYLFMPVDVFRSVDTMERVLKAACQVQSLNSLGIHIESESGESGLRALARVLPHTTHLRSFSATYFTGHPRIWPDYVLEELRAGFMQNTSIKRLDLSPELRTESVPSMFAARLHHQMRDPPIALLPHLMKQEGLGVGGVYRRNSMQTSIFMTLKNHASLVCGWIEQQKTNGKVNPMRCKPTRAERKRTKRKKAKRKAST